MGNNITIYDAAYVALALILDTKFYTTDKKLIEKLERTTKIVIHIAKLRLTPFYSYFTRNITATFQ